MSWGQQENQGQEIFYPCQFHQIFSHVVMLPMASVKEMSDIPSSVKESFRFRHCTESWALLWPSLQCCPSGKGLHPPWLPDYPFQCSMGAGTIHQRNGAQSKRGFLFSWPANLNVGRLCRTNEQKRPVPTCSLQKQRGNSNYTPI